MKFFRWGLTVASLVVVSLALRGPRASAHGTAIYLSAQNGRVVTDANIFTSTLATIPGFGHETEFPGISISSTDSKIANGAVLGFNVVDNLFYWDGGKLAPTSATLSFENSLAKSVAVTQSTIFEKSPVFGTYNGTTGWHEHGYFTLNLAAPVGAYGMVVTFTAGNLGYSEPVLLVFNRGLNSTQLDLGVKAMAATQFGLPGDLDLNGRVDGADYVGWANHYKQPGTLSEGDFTRDGFVDGADYVTWANNYTGSDNARAMAVPEPGSIFLALAGCFAVGIAWGVKTRRRVAPPA